MISLVIHVIGMQANRLRRASHNAEIATFTTLLIDYNSSSNFRHYIYLSIRIICSLSVLPLRPFLRTRTLPLREGDKKGSRSASGEAMPGSPISYILIRPPKIQIKSDTYLLNAIKIVARMPPPNLYNKNFI